MGALSGRSVDAFPSSFPPINEGGGDRGVVVAALRRRGAWREIIVVDDGSTDDTGAQAAAAGARSSGIPTTRATARRSRRHPPATGEYVLILDGDGQHQPADALRLVARLGEYDLVVGARSARRRRLRRAALGNAALNWLASYLTGREIPDLTSGSARRAASTCASSCTCCPTASRRRPRRRWRSSRRATTSRSSRSRRGSARGTSKIRLARDGAKFLLIILQDRDASSARCGSSCRSASSSFLLGRGLRALDDRRRSRTSPTRRSC